MVSNLHRRPVGIAAYENATYREAVEYLERAVSLDPTSTKAHLYLADAYNERYCENCEFDPGQASEINDHWRVLAIAEYKKVLELDFSNTQALNRLGLRYYRQADLDEAEPHYRKAIEVDPSNSEALYTLAVINWERSYGVRMREGRTQAQPQAKPHWIVIVRKNSGRKLGSR